MTDIRRALLASIKSWDPHNDPLRWDDARFDELARAVFAHQYRHNEPYQRFCQGRGVRPDQVTSYREIPSVPTDVFKHVRLSASVETARTFRTSGTTQGLRGAHHFDDLELYAAALQGPFARFCVPDARPMRMLFLAPSTTDLPESSLSYMLGELEARWALAGSAYFVEAGAEGLQLRAAALAAALREAERDGEPVMVLGTGFAFVELFDQIEGTFRLPEGSRVMETGGFKGRTRELSREALYALFRDRLGVPMSRCVSEYSMTELSSQAYTAHLRHEQLGDPLDDVPFGEGLHTPPWARVDVVDPVTLQILDTPGAVGLVRWTDLANLNSVCAVQTSDRGVIDARGGLRLLGRAPDSELRGCGLTIEEIVHGAS